MDVFILQTKTPCFRTVLMLGTAKANDVEPLAAISDWLLSDPYITWDKQMKEAERVSFEQKYHL